MKILEIQKKAFIQDGEPTLIKEKIDEECIALIEYDRKNYKCSK